MRIRIVVPSDAAARWHLSLAERLRAGGHRVAWTVAAPSRFFGGGVGLVLGAQARLYGVGGPRPGEPLGTAAFQSDAEAAERHDLVVDLSGGAAAPPGALVPTFDGSTAWSALLAALLDRRAPELAVVRDGAVLAWGRPAVPQPAILPLALDHVLSRLVDCLQKAVEAAAGGRPPEAAASPAAPAGEPGFAAAPLFAARTLAGQAARRLGRALRADAHWRVGWRRVDGPGVLETGAWPDEAYRWLPDDGRRFFADPFPVEHKGGVTVLCEEYPFATGKGVISAFAIRPDGIATEPRVVLERPFHLSYPFVFRHAGGIWMIPETSDNGTVELYRADPFPDRWVLDRVLLEGVCASDATLIEHEGRWWLFATTTAPQGSTWDCLSLYHADSPFGPWRAHPANPVLIDAAAARPAGAMVRHGGRWWRAAQDCRGGYGAGLTVCRVEQLDLDGFRQSIVHRLAPPARWRADGAHTLNRAGRIEVVDASMRRLPT